jgi:striatin 1/3/4
MTQKINQLEGMLRAQESINEDLIKRIKMLEYCLREERIKYASLMRKMSSREGADDIDAPVNIIESVLSKANLNATLYDKIAKRRAKAQRPLLLK